jgi:hypothetical protein
VVFPYQEFKTSPFHSSLFQHPVAVQWTKAVNFLVETHFPNEKIILFARIGPAYHRKRIGPT